jgi:hypothetical protein
VRSRSGRTTLALDAVRAAIEALDKLAGTDEQAGLLGEARTCEGLVAAWTDRPPSAEEREELMRRVLALNVAVAKLRRP